MCGYDKEEQGAGWMPSSVRLHVGCARLLDGTPLRGVR